MQLLYTHSDSRHLCLLDAAEVAQLQGTPPKPPGRARSTAARRAAAGDRHLQRHRPCRPRAAGSVVDEQGCRLTLASWAQLLLGGRWKAPGVGEVRL